MPNVKYTDSATFRCLENLKEGSLDISLIHTGKEHCPPGHICSMPRDEFIIHFVLDGTGFYSDRRSDLEPYSRTDVCNLSK